MSNAEHDRTTDAEATEQAAIDVEPVSDSGGDSDPGASTAPEPTGEAQAARNREDDPPA